MQMYDQFQTDGDAERTGIWLDYGTYQIRIARAGGSNKKFAKRLDALTQPYRRAIATETMDPDLIRRIMCEAYADAVVLDWKVKVGDEWQSGIEQPDSYELLPVTKPNIMDTFTNLPELFEDVQEQARMMKLFRTELRKDAAENS